MKHFEMSGAENELTATELRERDALERTVRRCETMLLYRAVALRAIRDKRLYRADGTFDNYLKKHWDLTRQSVHRDIRAVEVIEELEAADLPAPRRERQARPLAALTSEQRIQVAEIVAQRGGFGACDTRTVEKIAESVKAPPGRNPGSRETLALVVTTPSGVAVDRGTRAFLRIVSTMATAARALKARYGAYAIPEAVAAMSSIEADELRNDIADIYAVVWMLTDSLVQHHGDRPYGQQRLLVVA